VTTNIISNPARVWAYVSDRIPVPVVAGMKGLGLERDGELVAGVIYEGFNGVNVWMHVAASPGRRWMNKEYLRYCFHYPFVEMGVQRVSGAVDASNLEARRFDEHLGFKQEAVLKGAAADGGDVILYVMRPEDCRFLARTEHESLAHH
jgi:RimJ/RimL family protein N-acetyltransferase